MQKDIHIKKETEAELEPLQAVAATAEPAAEMHDTFVDGYACSPEPAEAPPLNAGAEPEAALPALEHQNP